MDMKTLRAVLAKEIRKTSKKDADDILHHTETWHLTVALEAMERVYETGYADGRRSLL